MEMPLCLRVAVLVLPALASAQDARAPRLAVVPFAALSGDVPQGAGARAAGLLATELRNAEGLTLVSGPSAPSLDTFREELDEARGLVEEAKGLRAKRRFRDAEQSLSKAVQRYAQGAPGLADVAELQDAYMLLSATQYNTGRDEEGANSLTLALALASTREPPLARTSRLFAQVVSSARKALLEGPKGALLMESIPAGATAFVDGVPMGATPLQIRDVPSGLHLWRVLLPSGEGAGGLVQVSPSRISRVLGQTSRQDPESNLMSALAQNRIDPAVIETARAHAQSVQADMLIFGAVSREGQNLALDSFVLKVASGELKRLPRLTFDTELLSARMEFYNLAGRLAKEGLRTGSDARLPGPISPEQKRGSMKVAEVRYGEAATAMNRGQGAVDGDVSRTSSGGTEEPKPPEQKKRSPLRRPGQ